MNENDSIQAFQRSMPRRSKQPNMVDPAKQKRDEFIMDTNNSSIVSKRSVEKLYYAGQPEYFRHFVGKFKRRSPLINRGYWLRMRAIEHTVESFLREVTGKRKVVINLGCGYDPLPWLFLGKQPEICKDAVFVDVDYPQLMQKKYEMIDRTPQLKDLLLNLAKTGKDSGLLAHSAQYAVIGCDLRNLDFLQVILDEHLHANDCSVAVLFVAEVSVAYMTLEASQAVMEWAGRFPDARFCLLEQHLPDGKNHPFAQTMLKHFEKLRTPLHAIGTMEQMKARFSKAGWPEEDVTIRPLWDLWSDENFLTAEQRRALDGIEPFDEWEEFALFASHYFLLIARTANAKSSLAAMRGSSLPQVPTINFGGNLETTELAKPWTHRRFAAAIPGSESVGLNAGLGTKERVSSTETYARHDNASRMSGPPLRSGLMCHTITKLGETDDCILIGGRTSPDKASAECWLRKGGSWTPTQPLPQGRYRHCAVAITIEDEFAVLVYGGRYSNGELAKESLLWTSENGWIVLAPGSPSPSDAIQIPVARFGAVMCVDKTGIRSPGSAATQGSLIGGMSSDGTIVEDWWTWTIWKQDQRTNLVWQLAGNAEWLKSKVGDVAPYVFRFGAQITTLGVDSTMLWRSPSPMLVGGIVGRGMLTKDTEIVTLSGFRVTPHRLLGSHRPLLVGHTPYQGLILGGGATCFSFGTYWNSGCELRGSNHQNKPSEWRLLTAGEENVPEPVLPPERTTTQDAQPTGDQPPIHQIARVALSSAADFQAILSTNKPVILTACDIGPCTSKWTPDYLSTQIGPDRQIAVHVSPSPTMDFQRKNFHYATIPFSNFLSRAQNGEHLYLRALSATSPAQTPTNLSSDFPSIASDFTLPDTLAHVREHAHSSPLRISGPVNMWLHYDVLANILCQIRGRKRLLLFPPHDIAHLSFPPGASSSSTNVFASPPPAQTTPHEALLSPGEILFIPPLWLHAAAPEPEEGLSVAVNVFFRSLEKGYAAGRDVYGNRDLAAYEKGRRDLERIRLAFGDLPREVKGFYLGRLARELGDMAGG